MNFTVDDLECYVLKLKEKQVIIHQEIETFEYGKFAQIEDIAGNILELCQLNQDLYRKMVEEEIKVFNQKRNLYTDKDFPIMLKHREGEIYVRI